MGPWTRLAAAALALLAGTVARAEEALDAFNSLYGEELKRVASTPSPADDVALAGQLLEAAKTAKEQPALLALLCEKAYELGARDPGGYATALAALDLEAEKTPDKKVACSQKRVALYQRQYGAARGDARTQAGETLVQALTSLADDQAADGDRDASVMTLRQAITVATAIRSEARADLQAQLGAMLLQQQLEKQAAALRAKLQADPKDDAARKELVRLYLVELDDPAAAATFVNDRVDETNRKYVPAAAKGVEGAPELACQELGDWYRGLADQTPNASSKAAMLARAKAYYERFLVLHAAADLPRTAATLALKKVEDALARLGPASGRPTGGSTPGGWIDCLKLVDPAKHTVKGSWVIKDAALMNTAWGIATVPVAPQGSYEVQVTFVRTEGASTVALCLPVGPRACALVLSAMKGQASGLEFINGSNVTQSTVGTVRPGTLTNGQEYVLGVAVQVRGEQADITATLNGKPLVQWQGPVAALTNQAWALPDGKFLGLGAVNLTIFRRVQFRSLGGLVKAPAETTAAAPADASGFRPLFNGKDLTGWQAKGTSWSVEPGGVLACGKGGGNDLWTQEKFDDFVLDLEFKMAKGTNSGVFLRCDRPENWLQGSIEIQIADSHGKPVSRQECGAICDILAPRVNATKPAGEWNRMAIAFKGNLLRVVLNDEPVLDTNLNLWTQPGRNPDGSPNRFKTAYKDMPKVGFLGLQDYGTPVWYRNIRIKPLSP